MAVTRLRATEEDLKRLPRDGRKFELIDGEIRQVPTAFEHDIIVAHIIRLVGPFADTVGLLSASQAGFRMVSGNIRCPDIGLTRYERLPGGRIPRGFAPFAPDLCLEVISPSEDERDSNVKIEEYFASGAREVWHLFPENESLVVYSSPSTSKSYGVDDEIESVDLLPGFRIVVRDLFSIPTIPGR